MSEQLRSMMTGTLGLWVLVIISAIITLSRFRLTADDNGLMRATRLAFIGIVCQSVHFLEEVATRFYERFPEVLGLTAWSRSGFIGLNVAWIVIWVVCACGLRRRIRIATFPLWFLALAMLVNGVAHVLLALRVQSYFPGLATAPVVGVVGYALTKALSSATVD